jgi:hypothetical protein
MGQSDRGVARNLPLADERNPFGDFGAAFGRRRQNEVGGGHCRHFDMQVDAVDERAGNASLIIGGATRVGAAAAV